MQPSDMVTENQTALNLTVQSLKQRWQSRIWIGLILMIASVALGQADDRLIGIWVLDEGFQTREYLFRSDGRYELDTKSSDPALGFSFIDEGRYEVNGQTLAFKPYDYLGEPALERYEFQIAADALTLARPEFSILDVY